MVEKDSRKAWIGMIVTWFTVVLAVIPTYGSLSVLSYTWINEFGLTTDQIGWISSALSVIFVFGPLENMLVHALGFWKTAVLATIMMSTGIAATAFATNFWHLLLSYSILVGIGSSLNSQIGFTVSNQYFDKHKSLAFAISQASTAAGLLIGPAVMEQMGRRIGITMYLVGLAALAFIAGCVMSAIHFWILRDTPKDTVTAESCSRETSEHDNDVEAIKTDSMNKHSSETTSKDASNYSIGKMHREVLQDGLFYLILLNYFCAGISQSVFMTYIIEFAVTSGYVSSDLAAFGQTAFGLASFVAALVLAALMRFNQRPMVFNLVTLLISGVSVFCFPLVKTVIAYFALNLIYGFSESMRLANMMSQIRNYSNTHIDTRIAYVYGVNGVGYVVGPIIAAQVIKITGLQVSFYVAGGFSIAASFLPIPILIRTYCAKSADKSEQSADKSEQSADKSEKSADKSEKSADKSEKLADKSKQSADKSKQSEQSA